MVLHPGETSELLPIGGQSKMHKRESVRPKDWLGFEFQSNGSRGTGLHWHSRNWNLFSGGLLHELFHVFGIMHEQKRPDRDRWAFPSISTLKISFPGIFESWLKTSRTIMNMPMKSVLDAITLVAVIRKRGPLFALSDTLCPVYNTYFQTHPLTATRSCYTGPKPSQRASPPWFPSMKLLAISGGHKTQLSRILHNSYAESEWNNRFLFSSDGLDLLSIPLEMVQMAPQSGIGRLLEGSPRYLVGRPTT